MSQEMARASTGEAIPEIEVSEEGREAVSVGSVLYGSEGCLAGLSGFETPILSPDSGSSLISRGIGGNCLHKAGISPSRTRGHACTGQVT